MEDEEDIFKRLFESEEVPPELEREIKHTLDATRLLLDITDLFTDKFIRTEYEFLKGADGDDTGGLG